jgi:hypothetical protein
MHSLQRLHQGIGSQQRTAVADTGIMAESAMPALSAARKKRAQSALNATTRPFGVSSFLTGKFKEL